jgi:hypothetical protein
MRRHYQLLVMILLALISRTISAQGLGSPEYGVPIRCWAGDIGSRHVRFCAQQKATSVSGQIFVEFQSLNGMRTPAPGSPILFTAPTKADGSFDSSVRARIGPRPGRWTGQ